MLKNIFRIPDTFDPDDRRRRQVLNNLVLVFLGIYVLLLPIALFHVCCSGENNEKMDPGILAVGIVYFLILLCKLLFYKTLKMH